MKYLQLIEPNSHAGILYRTWHNRLITDRSNVEYPKTDNAITASSREFPPLVSESYRHDAFTMRIKARFVLIGIYGVKSDASNGVTNCYLTTVWMNIQTEWNGLVWESVSVNGYVLQKKANKSNDYS